MDLTDKQWELIAPLLPTCKRGREEGAAPEKQPGISRWKFVEHAYQSALEERGGLDLRETLIDGSFGSAKKGGFALGQPSAESAPRSWQLSTAMVFLSPYALKAIRHMK